MRAVRISDSTTALLLMGTVAFALLVDEIMLSAIFHVLIGAGNTVAAIAIALVGLSASGVAAWLLPAFHRPETARITTLAFGIALMLSPLLLMAIPVSHGDFVYAPNELRVQLSRLAVYHIAVIPFFLGGLTLNIVIRTYPERIGRLYFADLGGAALGCVVSPFLLTGLGAPQAIVWAALPAVLLAGFYVQREGGRRRLLLLLPLGILALGALRPGLYSFSTLNTMGTVRDSAYRSFGLSPGDLEYERWALDAWTIIRSPGVPQQWEDFEGWALSSRYRGPVPHTRMVNYNARFSTYVTEFDGDFAPLSEWLDADLGAYHFQLGRSFASVLNIGAGGGREVLNALHHGAERVVAVDVSEVVVDDVMKSQLREFSGELYFDPRVTAVADEGRSFTERSEDRYDLIDFSIVGGANLEKMDLVRVDDLFTIEALRTYLSRLTDDGVFSYLMYTTSTEILGGLSHEQGLERQPYVPALRTLSGLRTAFEEAWPGRRFADHVLIAGLHGLISPRYDLVHIVVSRSPISVEERARFLALCQELDFLVFHPAPVPEAEASYNPYALVIAAEDRGALARELPYGIRPATDDRPFQVSLDRAELRRAIEQGSLFRLLAGDPLVALAVRIGGLALLVMAIPLAALALRRGGGAGAPLRRVWPLLLLFAGIGFAYMAVEIAALLKLQFYLGKPIYGLSVALFAFLLSSGLGSNATARFAQESLVGRIPWIAASIVVTGLAFFLASPSLFLATLGLPVAARAAIAVAAVFPMAFAMGMLFPIGIRLLAREGEAWIPWAWAINGGFSVLGIFGTRVTALFLGFSRALLIGLAVYVLAAGCVLLWARRRGQPEEPA
jgi:SAM-dependent methyltransferase